MRLINADALMYAVDGNPLTTDSLKEYVRSTVKAQPTVDAVPVRHGKWIDDNCSICGEYVYKGDRGNYCPNCGARMDEE